MLALSCSGLVAPSRTVETCGLVSVHARARAACARRERECQRLERVAVVAVAGANLVVAEAVGELAELLDLGDRRLALGRVQLLLLVREEVLKQIKQTILSAQEPAIK